MHRRSSNLCNNSVYSGGSCLLNAIVGAVSSSTALTSRGCCTGVWESTARLLRLVDSIQAKRRGGSSRQPARASRWSAPGQASGWRGHPGCWAWGGIQEAHRAGAGVAGGVGTLLCTEQPRCDGAHEIHGGARGGAGCEGRRHRHRAGMRGGATRVRGEEPAAYWFGALTVGGLTGSDDMKMMWTGCMSREIQ